MNVSELPDLPTEEGLQAEFRLHGLIPPLLAKTVAAMFNSGGGLVMVGYDDAGRSWACREIRTRSSAACAGGLENAVVPGSRFRSPSSPGPGGAGFLIEVPEGAQKPYLADGTIYVRDGNATQRAKPKEIAQLVTQRGRAENRWERQPAIGVGAEVLSEEAVREAYASARRRLDLSRATGRHAGDGARRAQAILGGVADERGAGVVRPLPRRPRSTCPRRARKSSDSRRTRQKDGSSGLERRGRGGRPDRAAAERGRQGAAARDGTPDERGAPGGPTDVPRDGPSARGS